MYANLRQRQDVFSVGGVIDCRGWRVKIDNFTGDRCEESSPEIPFNFDSLSRARAARMIEDLKFDLSELSFVFLGNVRPVPQSEISFGTQRPRRDTVHIRQAAADQEWRTRALRLRCRASFDGRVLLRLASEWLADLLQIHFDGYLGADWRQHWREIVTKIKAASWDMFTLSGEVRKRMESTYGLPRFGLGVWCPLELDA